ncbi:hypothetical protein Sj15T_10030 [Sphingobium sp. TA15]|uniref:Putative DNA methylase n=1 Tax=Sphingobium indicum (strain DSM 16413 / CCM 7287 / MTCC 6362 / UT26 / NBRC 101211 / UT26S) TaxID=452662 RepID=D4Z8S4_SPHIU|nr:putative DNA methylase [Sphingobium indicum UT26S]BDD65982.1 hypothetical protein Sj15T_10030 [Sphingobium sp. TA15]
MLHAAPSTRVIRHAHVFCGLGAGARGFNMAKARVGNVVARFLCTGGIDVDAGAIRNFERLTGTPGTVMDLFSREQYRAFHGHEPPPGWREATPADVWRALVGADGIRPDVIFLSAPCKGFSGLLSSKQALTERYQALNALTLRGVWLICEAFKDGPIPIILFENVPRIQTRGRALLDHISAILRAYRYNIAETVHDCGELGGLAQSRKRFLLIARQREIIPNFIYEPEKKRLRGVGEVIGKLPLPGDPVAGAMHRIPMLQWKTWLRLALVPAGRDWRALNELAVVDGVLRDYGIVPDRPLRENALGVMDWADTAGVVIGNQRSPLHGRHSVADPRPHSADWNSDVLGVRTWSDASGTVPGRSGPTNGAHSVADPRYAARDRASTLGVRAWTETAGTVQGESYPTNGSFSVADPRPAYGISTHRHVLGVNPWTRASYTIIGSAKPSSGSFAVADPRIAGHPKSVQMGVRPWTKPAGVVTGSMVAGGGPNSVADPRISASPRFNNIYRVVAFNAATPSVADPRMETRDYKTTKYKITPWSGQTRTVIGASTTGDGAYAVADPRTGYGPNSHRNKMRVVSAEAPAPTVTGSDRVGSGALSVADPRPLGLNSPGRDGYATQGHYGVVGWGDRSYAVPAYAKYDRGHWSVADPRHEEGNPSCDDGPSPSLPAPDDRLVARIIALDGTWHRPFTTLDLAALQSIVDPEAIFYQDRDGVWHARMPFDLESESDSEKREWIGNAVPSESAAEIGSVIGEAILLAEMGETFTLSEKTIWVSPVRVALAVDSWQAATDLDGMGDIMRLVQ